MRDLLSKVKLEGPEILKVTGLPRGTIYCLQPDSAANSRALLLFSGTAGAVYQLHAAPNPLLHSKPKESFLVQPEPFIFSAQVVHAAPKAQRAPVYGFNSEPLVLFCEDGNVIIHGEILENFRFEASNGKGVARTGEQYCYFRITGGGLCKLDIKSGAAAKVDGVENMVDFIVDGQIGLYWLTAQGILHFRDLQRDNSDKKLSLDVDSLSNAAIQKDNPVSWHALLRTKSGRFLSAAYNLTHPHANTYILSDDQKIISTVSQGPARSIDQGRPSLTKPTTC